MNQQQALDVLRSARKETKMVTSYAIEDGPIVPQIGSGGTMRITRVVVTAYDNGYRDVTVKGHSVTKDGRKKSQDWHIPSNQVNDLFAEALLDL